MAGGGPGSSASLKPACEQPGNCHGLYSVHPQRFPYGNARAGNALNLAAVLAGNDDQQVRLSGTCMDARGLQADELIMGTRRSTLAQLADWTIEADKVRVF